MNMTEIEAAALLALAMLLIYSLTPKAQAAPAPAAAANPLPKTSEIVNNALPGSDAWGWKFYDNGTAIDPAGSYYFNGAQVTGK